MVGAVLAVIVVAAIPFEVVSFGLALFGSVTATGVLLMFRREVRRFNSAVAEIRERLPNEET